MVARTFRSLMLLITAIGLAGCFGAREPERASVSGMILLDGQPLENASLVLVPAEGVNGPASGAAIVQGKFSIPRAQGPFLGLYRVEVTAMKEDKSKSPQASSSETTELMASGAPLIQFIPPQYNQKSTLTLDVHAGENRYEVDLKSSP